MFSHIHVGVSDFDRAMAFYAPLMSALGLELKFVEADHPWAGWKSPGIDRPLFIIGAPYDGALHRAGNGHLAAFQVEQRADVDRLYALALELGGTDEGAPGLRPHYHPNYYGAYFRDTEGNKLCVCCHAPE
jgi:catechol 2,3-dioxygenase-like lactoylglutathione lyase family enzyme